MAFSEIPEVRRRQVACVWMKTKPSLMMRTDELEELPNPDGHVIDVRAIIPLQPIYDKARVVLLCGIRHVVETSLNSIWNGSNDYTRCAVGLHNPTVEMKQDAMKSRSKQSLKTWTIKYRKEL